MAETSRFWPYIAPIAKALTIPGTNIGLSMLVEMQDRLPDEEFKRDLKAALNVLCVNTGQMVGFLKEKQITVDENELREASLQLAEELYLKELADDFLYADFKGIEQVEHLVPLELDDIFVNLKASPERSEPEDDPKQRELTERL